MGRRTLSDRLLDVIRLIVAVVLLALLVFIALRVSPGAVVSMAPVVTLPKSGATIGADELPSLEGTADPGVTVQVFDGDRLLGETVAEKDGSFRFGLASMLAEGPHNVRALALDESGNAVFESSPVAFTVIPSGERVVMPLIVSPSGGASFTAGEMPVFDGTALRGATVRLYLGEMLLGETVAGSDGGWRFELPKALAVGTYALRAVVLDADGTEDISSGEVAFSVEERAVDPPSVNLSADASFAAGEEVAFDGVSAPGSTVRIYDGEILLGEAIAGDSGRWRFGVGEALSVGAHALRVAVLDSSGREVAASEAVAFHVQESVVAPRFLSPGSGGSFAASEVLALDGTAAPGATVRIYDGETLLGEAEAGAAGRWRFELTQPLATGPHGLRVLALDAAGEESEASDPLAITIVEPVVQPVILLPEAGDMLAGETLEGTAGSGARVLLYDGESLLGEAIADADGVWGFQLPMDLAAGTHTLLAMVVDRSGEPVAESEPADIEVLQLALALAPPTILLPDGGSVASGETVQGTATAGALLQIYDGDLLLGEATAGADGKWSFRLPDDLSSGEHTLRAVVVDEAGARLAESEGATFDMLELRLPVTGGF